MPRERRHKTDDLSGGNRPAGHLESRGERSGPAGSAPSARPSWIAWILAFILLTAGIAAVRWEIIDSPPYYDFATGLFVEADFLARTNFDYEALYFEEDRWLLGGAGVYLTSVLPTFLAVLMKVLPTSRDVLTAYHLFTFACASVTALAVFAIVRNQTHRVGGILICAGLLTLPVFSVQIDMLGMDLPMTACAVVAAWLALGGRYTWAAVASTLAFLMKATGMLVSVSLCIYIVLMIVLGHKAATPKVRRGRWLGLCASSVALALQMGFNDWVAQISRRSSVESWELSKELFFGDSLIGMTRYWFPDVLALLALALFGSLILLIIDLANRPRAATTGNLFLTLVRALPDVLMRRRPVLFGWIVIVLLSGVMSLRYVLPRYCTLGVPFLFAILGTILFSVRSGQRAAAVAVCVLILFNVANWNGDFYPAQDFSYRTGACLERSHEYLKDHRSNIEAVRLLVAEHDGLPIVAPMPFVQFLTLPTLGYVDEPIEGYSLNRFTGPTFHPKTQIREDLPREVIVVFLESGYAPPGEIPRPEATSEILKLPSGQIAAWSEPSELIVYRKKVPAGFSDSDASGWYWNYLWREKRVLNVATRLLEEDKFAEAEALYREVLASAPYDTDALYGLAFSQYSQGSMDAALDGLAKVLDFDSQHGQAHELAGTILFKAGKKEEGIAHLRQAARYVSEEAEAEAQTYFLLGSMLASTGEKIEAEDYYRRVIELNPLHANAQHLFGRLLAARGEVDKGLEHILKAIDAQPNHATALYDAGQVYESLGEVTQAMNQYRHAMDVRIGWPEPANNLAMILATHPDDKIRDAEEAVRCAKIACEISRDDHPNPAFLDTLAAALAESKRYDEAVETIERAIELFQKDGGGATMLGGMRARLKLYENHQPYRIAPRKPSP